MTQPSDLPLGPPPRKAHLRRALRNVRRAYRTVFALVILVFGGWAVIDAFRWHSLVYRIETTQATILKKTTTARPAGHDYRLEYSFTTADGTNILHETTVDLAVFEKTAEGQPCPIVYLPENPRVDHWLFDNHAARLHVMYLTIGYGIAVVLALVVWRLVERPLQRELRLARHGIVTPGNVMSISQRRGRRGNVRITYSFVAPAGQTIQGACNLPRRFPVENLTPGTSIDIVVDPKNPNIHKPRLALDHVEFGELAKKKTPGA